MYPKSDSFHRHVLNNGITLLLQKNHTVDLVAGRIFLKNSGSCWDKRTQAGLFNLLSKVIIKGTEEYSSIEIAEKIESTGASLGTDVTNDYFVLGLKTVGADFKEILELAAEILQKPSFPESEIELEKQLLIRSIHAQKEQPFNVAYSQLRESMYLEHPYAISVLGKEETVSGLDLEALQTCYRNHFQPKNCIISLSGNLDITTAISYIETFFNNWHNYEVTLDNLNLPAVPNSPQYRFTQKDTQQEIVMLGYFAPPVTSKDYPALKLLSTYLGNGLSSRLFVELREKLGLAYEVSAIYPSRLDLSQFILYMGTAPENTETAKQGLEKEAERLVNKKLSLEELENAKNKLLGQYALGKQTNSDIAQLNGWYETSGLGLDFDAKFDYLIKSVTPEIAQEVAQKYLVKPYISLVGPKAITEQ